MLSDKELRDVDVRQWGELQNQFRGADILLGNGFSITLAPQLGYGSLFDNFLGTCGAAQQKLFKGLETTNFEELQRFLLDAKRVADLLGTPLTGIEDHIAHLREGLIRVIHESHPRAKDIDKDKLHEISKQLDQFGNIFTTSYDLFLYHIIMICKDRSLKDASAKAYNDYFWRLVNEKFLEFTGFQNYPYKHVYYLHGALFIFSGADAGRPEIKLRRGDDWELLDAIAALIKEGRLPLFVSEGTSAQKVRAIALSSYLRFARERLARAAERIVIYGSALNEKDAHILRTLNDSRRSIAVSLFVGDKGQAAVEEEVKTSRAKLARHDVVVFDSRGLF